MAYECPTTNPLTNLFQYNEEESDLQDRFVDTHSNWILFLMSRDIKAYSSTKLCKHAFGKQTGTFMGAHRIYIWEFPKHVVYSSTRGPSLEVRVGTTLEEGITLYEQLYEDLKVAYDEIFQVNQEECNERLTKLVSYYPKKR